MLAEIEQGATARMKKTVATVRTGMARIRTGRATTALLDHLRVDYYGTMTPISQVATIAVIDPRTLQVQPWEKSMLAVVEKAILESDLGLNPVTAGETMKIPLPSMTEQRRLELGKLVRQEGENGKVGIRNIRRDAIHMVRDLHKEKNANQDEMKTAETALQKLTDQYIAEIEQVVAGKEKEVMEV